MMKRHSLILITLFMATSIASAGETGAYLGAGLGQARADITGLTTDSDKSFQLFAGYGFNKNLNAEITYIDFGQIAAGTNKIDSTGTALTVVGVIPLQGNTAVYGRFGMANVKSKSSTTSDSRSDLTWGVGGQLDFSYNGSVRLEYNNYAVGDKNGVDGNYSTLTLAMLYRF